MNKILIVAALAAISAAANAVIVETEPNNSIATANLITLPLPEGADSGLLNLGRDDVDYFKLIVTGGSIISASAIPITNPLVSPDMELGLFDSTGSLLAFSDDTAFGATPFIVSSVGAGTYYIAATGSGDDSFVGNHSQSGTYQLNVAVSPVPEPASFAALGVGAVALLRRRNGAKR